MYLKFARCFESNRAGMTFPLKCGYVKLSFKSDPCLTISWPMFPSCGTKQRPTYKIDPQTKLHLFSGSRIPQARYGCEPKWSVPCGRDDKGGHKVQELPEVCAVKQTPQLQFCPSIGPLLHRNLAICPNSGRKKVSDKDAERSENFKIQILVSCSTGTHTHTQKEIWKIIFLIIFLKLNAG